MNYVTMLCRTGYFFKGVLTEANLATYSFMSAKTLKQLFCVKAH